MTASSLGVFSVGVVGQLLFAARTIVQWFHSEKARRPVSPVLFWYLSLVGSIAFFAYGVLRRDLAIVLGQLLVYFIYVRNLQLKERWGTVSAALRWLVYFAPMASVAYLLSSAPGDALEIVRNPDVPAPLVVWGALAQVVFTLRFFVQWLESEARKESVLSPVFWGVSLVGSTMIMSYAALRRDPVLFLGQLGGAVAYVRNLALGARS